MQQAKSDNLEQYMSDDWLGCVSNDGSWYVFATTWVLDDLEDHNEKHWELAGKQWKETTMWDIQKFEDGPLMGMSRGNWGQWESKENIERWDV